MARVRTSARPVSDQMRQYFGGERVYPRAMPRKAILAASLLGILSVSEPAQAFCGFYVAPSDAPLYADATMVALMREGTRTALSMSNNYKGPAADFAMVVPVPVVLQKEN